MARIEGEIVNQKKVENVKKLKREDWRIKDYWWCESNKTVHIEKHCESCRLLGYKEILKKMQELR
jgi:polyisoprenoid-binding protein YceI